MSYERIIRRGSRVECGEKLAAKPASLDRRTQAQPDLCNLSCVQNVCKRGRSVGFSAALLGTGLPERLLATGPAASAEKRITPTEHLRNTHGTPTDIPWSDSRVLPWQHAPDKLTTSERGGVGALLSQQWKGTERRS